MGNWWKQEIGLRFEERNNKIPDKVILWEREMEVGERQGEPKNKWKIKKKECYERGRISIRQVERRRMEEM